MKNQSSHMLIAADDPPPVRVINPQGRSPFLLIGDHAGNRIPSGLGTLGVPAGEMQRHIAWDIGIAELGEALSATIDAVFVRQTYSRLIVDCNRDPQAADAMPAVSDGSVVPGNQALDDAGRAARVAAIHAPYQAAIAEELARRDAAGQITFLVSLHSFTPRMNGHDRPWQIGILHSGGDARFALALLKLLREQDDLCVGDNEPYAMDGIDYTVPLHAFAARRRYVEIEIRQDLLSSVDQAQAWASRIAPLLERAGAMIG
jgi:predicted N-formylglutamate amidohydrolase